MSLHNGSGCYIEAWLLGVRLVRIEGWRPRDGEDQELVRTERVLDEQDSACGLVFNRFARWIEWSAAGQSFRGTSPRSRKVVLNAWPRASETWLTRLQATEQKVGRIINWSHN